MAASALPVRNAKILAPMNVVEAYERQTGNVAESRHGSGKHEVEETKVERREIDDDTDCPVCYELLHEESEIWTFANSVRLFTLSSSSNDERCGSQCNFANPSARVQNRLRKRVPCGLCPHMDSSSDLRRSAPFLSHVSRRA